MLYITLQDIIDAYSEDDVLMIADPERVGTIDSAVVDTAISKASALVDGYVGSKYALPLPSVPMILVQPCVDIAVYFLSGDAGSMTEQRKERYKDAKALLSDIARGVVSLGLPEAPTSGTNTVYSNGNNRNFGRGNKLL